MVFGQGRSGIIMISNVTTAETMLFQNSERLFSSASCNQKFECNKMKTEGKTPQKKRVME